MSTTGYAYALQKTSKIKRSLVWKSECDRFAENLKNKAIACCERVSDRLAENLKNKAIAQKTLKM